MLTIYLLGCAISAFGYIAWHAKYKRRIGIGEFFVSVILSWLAIAIVAVVYIDTYSDRVNNYINKKLNLK